MKLGRKEFETLAMEQLDLLYRIARRMTRDQASAEDLVQETYLRALRSHASFDLKEFGIRPWLLRIMHNLHMSRFKREKRQPATLGDQQLEAAAKGVGQPLPRDNFDGMDQQLVRALDQLPEDYQTVLLLWAIEEMSYKEIAHALEVPIGTVMSRLHRARTRLSDLLHDYAAGEGLIRDSRE